VGSPSGLTADQLAHLRRLLPARKIEAIKLFREITGVGLAEAKDAVEALEAGEAPGGGVPRAQTLSWEAAVHQGVRTLRQQAGVSLYDAKAIVDVAGVLPAGLRAPSQKEAVELTDLVARGAVEDAAARLGALFGLDPTTATDVAGRLRSARRRPRVIFAAIALGLLAAAAWIAWRAITG
jgi:ribosomal protein L7/L12